MMLGRWLGLTWLLIASALLACSSDETTPHPVPVDAASDAKAARDAGLADAAPDGGPSDATPDQGGQDAATDG